MGLVCDEVANLLKIFMRKFLRFAHLLADAHQMTSTGIVKNKSGEISSKGLKFDSICSTI
jgi:hypothetical protein